MIVIKKGKIAVYPLNVEVTDDLIAQLKFRARLNPELRYFATAKVRWNGCWCKDIETVLSQKLLTDEDIKRLVGLVEL